MHKETFNGKLYTIVPQNPFHYWSWENQVRQYPKEGAPGISYFRGDLEPGNWVDCLLYRDRDGEILGILNYYNQDEYQNGVLTEKKGNFCIFTAPKAQRQGIGKKLLEEGIKRYNIVLEDQMWTPQGFELLKSFLTGKVKQPKSKRTRH